MLQGPSWSYVKGDIFCSVVLAHQRRKLVLRIIMVLSLCLPSCFCCHHVSVRFGDIWDSFCHTSVSTTAESEHICNMSRFYLTVGPNNSIVINKISTVPVHTECCGHTSAVVATAVHSGPLTWRSNFSICVDILWSC